MTWRLNPLTTRERNVVVNKGRNKYLSKYIADLKSQADCPSETQERKLWLESEARARFLDFPRADQIELLPASADLPFTAQFCCDGEAIEETDSLSVKISFLIDNIL